MKEFEKKRIIRKRIYSKFTAVVLLIILVFLIKGTVGIFSKTRESQRQLSLVSDKLGKLERKHENIKQKLENTKSLIGQEEQIRSKYLLAKDGENAIFIIDSEEEENIIEEKSILKNYWQRARSWFDF